MGNDGILPIICETTRNANMADVIHCQNTEVISEGTGKSVIFLFEHNVGLQKRGLAQDTWVAGQVERCAALPLLPK